MPDDAIRVQPLDLGYMRQDEAAAAFLVTKDDTRILVESGPVACFDRLRAGLRSASSSIDQLDGLLLTHIHLDHAGASGLLTSARCHVFAHPRGARHLVDPDRLNASARRVFGTTLDSDLGMMEPNHPDRVHEITDGGVVNIGALSFEALETPGHANHHHAWILRDERHVHVFCGDAAGMRLPGTEFPTIPMVPPEFDLQTWNTSLHKLRETNADSLWLTHFGHATLESGFVDNVEKEMNAEVEFLSEMITKEGRHLPEAHRAWHRTRAQAHGVAPQTLEAHCRSSFYRANYDGVARWLSKSTPRPTDPESKARPE